MNLEARQLAREAYRRWAYEPPKRGGVVADRAQRFMRILFEQQLAFIEDESRRKAAFGTRRCGKTTLVAAYFSKTMIEHEGVLCTFYAITRLRAKELIWDDLKRLDADYALGFRFNETELSVRAGNGSILRLTGADKMHEAEKKRGDKNKLVILDEAQMYPEDVLENLIENIIEPTLMDLRGTVCLMGTPGIVCAGLWYRLTRNEATERTRGWSVHSWSVLDNPHMPHAAEEIRALQESKGWPDDNPTLVREWRGRWVNDSGALFYRYSDVLNGNHARPDGKPWSYVLGVDLGHDDAFALHAWAFSPQSRDLYAVESFKKPGLTPTDWKEHIKSWLKRYQPIATVIDSGGLGKAFVVELQNRDALPVQAAEKKHKAAYVKLMNDDFTAGRIHIDKVGPYAAELRVLAKDKDDELKEDPRCPNHLCDAALYAWREAQHYLGAEPTKGPPPGSPEAIAQQEAELEEQLEQRERQRHEQSTQDEIFGWGSDADFGGGFDDSW